MSSEMFERVMKALQSDNLFPVNDFIAGRLARAVLEEMRIPTKAMLKASDSIMGGGFQNSHSDAETWEAMIESALSPS